MKRTLIAAALLMTASAHAQEWRLASEADNDKFYVDVSSIRKVGGLIRAWELNDYAESFKHGMENGRSMVAYLEYDCAQERYRPLQITAYEGQRGQGRSLGTISNRSDWSFAPPGSVGASKLTFVCQMANKR